MMMIVRPPPVSCISTNLVRRDDDDGYMIKFCDYIKINLRPLVHEDDDDEGLNPVQTLSSSSTGLSGCSPMLMMISPPLSLRGENRSNLWPGLGTEKHHISPYTSLLQVESFGTLFLHALTLSLSWRKSSPSFHCKSSGQTHTHIEKRALWGETKEEEEEQQENKQSSMKKWSCFGNKTNKQKRFAKWPIFIKGAWHTRGEK